MFISLSALLIALWLRFRLIPIDHGMILTDVLDVATLDLVWFDWPQSKVSLLRTFAFHRRCRGRWECAVTTELPSEDALGMGAAQRCASVSVFKLSLSVGVTRLAGCVLHRRSLIAKASCA